MRFMIIDYVGRVVGWLEADDPDDALVKARDAGFTEAESAQHIH